MRKILNLLIVFVLSIMVVGIGFNNVKAEATTDVTITFHIHQYDGDYTNTGIGIWDGVTWNGWDDLQSSVDDFGAVIEKTYTALEINAVMSDIQLEITRNSQAGVDGSDTDAQAGYLSPGDGKTFVDVSTLQDGSATSLDVYYVEGAEELVYAEDGLGLMFVVYLDPEVAGGDPVYEGWQMWSWNNGTDGTTDLLEFDQSITIKSGIYGMEGRLGVIAIDDDATEDTGFKFRLGEWVEESSEFTFDNTDLRGSGAQIMHIEKGVADVYDDGITFYNTISEHYELFAGNKFIDPTFENGNYLSGTIISTPTEVSIEFLMPRNPLAYDESRFVLRDADGVVVPVSAVNVSTAGSLGDYTSDVTCAAGENKFVLYVDSGLDNSLLGVIGSVQGWITADAISSTKDDENGSAVFEICTTLESGYFKLIYDVDEDGFDDEDIELTQLDQAFAFNNETEAVYIIEMSTQVGAFTGTVTPAAAERYLVIHVESALDHSKIGIVGSVNGWDINNPIMSTGDDTEGYAVFEIATVDSDGAFIVVYDALEDWDWGDKIAGASADLLYDMDAEMTQVLFIDPATDPQAVEVIDGSGTVVGTFTQSITLAEEQRYLVVYIDSALDHSKIGLVGDFQGWDVVNPIMSTMDDAYGYAIFEVAITGSTGAFTVVYDAALDFGWDDKIAGVAGDLTFDMGEELSTVLFIDELEPEAVQIISDDSAITPLDTLFVSFTLETANELQFNEEYYVEYIDAVNTVTQTYIVVHVDSALDHAKLGIVGTVQGWDVANPIMSIGDDTLGYAVFEIASDDAAGEFVILYDVDGDGFTWDATLDTKITPDNQLFDAEENGSIVLFIDADVVNPLVPTIEVVVEEMSVGTYTQEVFPTVEKYLVVHIESALDHSKIGLVGTMQGWDVGNPIMSTGDDSEGYAVFEIALSSATGEFLVVYDAAADWDWGDKISGDNNLTFDMGTDMALELFVDATTGIQFVTEVIDGTGTDVGTYTQTVTPADEKYAVLYVKSVLDPSRLGIVGDIQGWNIDSPIMSTQVDENGYVVFEFAVSGSTGTFKVVYDAAGDGFSWDATLDPQVTPGDQSFDLGEEDSIVLFVDEVDPTVVVLTGEPGIAVGTFTQTVTVTSTTTEEIIYSKMLGFDLSNNFIAGDTIAVTGTFAVSETEFIVEFVNAAPFMTDIVLVDSAETVIAVEEVDYIYGMGEYTELVSCTSMQSKLIVYLNTMDTEITDLSQLGLVGSIQGWNPSNGINPVGMDSLGNYVFEICLYSADEDINETSAEFKILFDADGVFDWGDASMNPDNVKVDIDPLATIYIEEGNANTDTKYQVFTLLEANALSTDETYQLRFTDENGFLVYLDLEIDNVEPVLYDTIKPDVMFNVEMGSSFDIMDYYNILEFIDGRAGNIDYVVTSDIDTAVLGEQTFTVTATDLWMNEATFSVDFTVVDTTVPVITLSAAPELEVGDTEPDWATYATANEGTITVNSSQVNMDAAGTYFVNFTATDDSDNVTTVGLEVTVEAVEVPVEDTTGCFGSIGNGSAFIIFGVVAVLGGAALFFLKRN